MARPTLRQFAREAGDVAVAVPMFAAAPLLRRWHRRWGATDAEVAAAMPGDELVPGAYVFCTRAITIDAPPETVWPWLVQVGFGQAGFYSFASARPPGFDSMVLATGRVEKNDRYVAFA